MDIKKIAEEFFSDREKAFEYGRNQGYDRIQLKTPRILNLLLKELKAKEISPEQIRIKNSKIREIIMKAK